MVVMSTQARIAEMLATVHAKPPARASARPLYRFFQEAR